MYNRNYVTLAECDNHLQVLSKYQEAMFFGEIKRNKKSFLELELKTMSSQIITEAICASF